jgi:1,4-alpha-glucan branching enzyme
LANVCQRDSFGTWTCFIPDNKETGAPAIPHDTRVKIALSTHDGHEFDRFSTWTRFVRQEGTKPEFCPRWWAPAQPYRWLHESPLSAFHASQQSLRIYETHIGMSGEEGRVTLYREFTRDVLPHVRATGYNAIQVMAVMEHSYYASFGYQVTSFFAPASRCGTPEELMALIDAAHGMGILVLLDIVHSHASKNQLDGVSHFDGTDAHYFHGGGRGEHPGWNSRLFNYGNYETKRFLLSNVAYWLEVFKFDGFRFDGVTSMLYLHHGLDACDFFNEAACDADAATYLTLATKVALQARPGCIIIAEEVSGWPGLAHKHAVGGMGFTHRLAMALPDLWIKYLKHKSDEQWDMAELVFELTNRPHGQASVAYCESHDQALVGDKTIAFWLMDADMYTEMTCLKEPTERVRRGMALHKMIRLLTCALGGEAWLCFMGNEFGHPEWLDFPREGNNWSFHHCRRQWHLARDPLLRYKHLLAFDRAMLALETRHSWLRAEQAFVSLKHDGDKIIAFDRPRGELYFVFNFHWWKQFEAYPIGVDRAGDYRLKLDSAEQQFGGTAPDDRKLIVRAQPTIPGQPHAEFKPFYITVTIPSRTVQVFELVKE